MGQINGAYSQPFGAGREDNPETMESGNEVATS
jgi:hypothetical protein